MSRQAAVVGKGGIQLAVGIEPGQAARNRRAVSVRDAAHHDLPVRLQSDCLRLVFRVAAEGEVSGTEGSIHDPGFEETLRFDGSVEVAAGANSLGHNIVTVRLKNDRGTATRSRLVVSRSQCSRRYCGLQHSRGAEFHR